MTTTPKPVLVTGDAGCIGSHACEVLARAGYLPVSFDNLDTGWADAVKFGPLERGDLADRATLDAVFARWHRGNGYGACPRFACETLRPGPFPAASADQPRSSAAMTRSAAASTVSSGVFSTSSAAAGAS